MSFMNGVLADDVQDLAKEVPCRENEETRANRAASTRGEKGSQGVRRRQTLRSEINQGKTKVTGKVRERYDRDTQQVPN